MIEVCTVFAPRPSHEQWRDDYVDLLRAQRHSVLRIADHRHTVVTDSELPGFDTIRADLPCDLMPAMIAGIVHRLSMPVDDHIVFVDADCLVELPLRKAFRRRNMDIALTFREHPTAPVNNGVMYVNAEGAGRALHFFRSALTICKTHWGADQEAISRAAAPVPNEPTLTQRCGALIMFVTPKVYAAVPKERLARHSSFVVHFKGETKRWMLDYAALYHGYGATVEAL